MTFRFRCNTCEEIHEGVPTFGADMPAIAQWIPPEERQSRVDLGSDDCVVDGERFLVRGCLEIPVADEADPFVWGVWVDISQDNFDQWVKAFNQKERSHIGPFPGYLGTALPCYPDTFNHRVVMHLRDNGIRPYIEVSQSDHPLHIEQCNGITHERLVEIYEEVMHGVFGRAA
ncbi:hypothetical protein J2X06_000516 [Lysobacter niastensis]|uniref:DUF2199 domain-containing protein n=1 Tax=Lysobacter niastensis TaxID=380629 RepID=A0ABU1W6X5_9GAMM|nr:DUF2199 domain-containing protein [Lysobacter niastensis]MDR7133332.1 hypothetical protein [Lysobacter niastensis]